MESILLIKPGSLGDVVHALPVAAALHNALPESALTWVIDPRWRPVLANNAAVSKCFEFPREQFRGLAGFLRLRKWYAGLRKLRPCTAIDLQCLLRSALIATLSGAKKRIGLSDAREGARHFYHAAADVRGRLHAVDRYLAVLPLLGVEIPTRPQFPIAHGEPAGTDLPGDFLLLHPFARGAGKSLSAGHIIRFCEAAGQHPVVIAGLGRTPDALPSNAINLANTTSLPQLIWLLRRASTVVSVDSGPMHLAAAAGTRLLSIHTWSDPRKVGPYSTSAFVWQGGKLRPQQLGHDTPLLPEAAMTDSAIVEIAEWAQAPA